MKEQQERHQRNTIQAQQVILQHFQMAMQYIQDLNIVVQQKDYGQQNLKQAKVTNVYGIYDMSGGAWEIHGMEMIQVFCTLNIHF